MDKNEVVGIFLTRLMKEATLGIFASQGYFPKELIEGLLEAISKMNFHYIETENIDVMAGMPEELKERCLNCDKDCEIKDLLLTRIDAKKLKPEKKTNLDFFWDNEEE